MTTGEDNTNIASAQHLEPEDLMLYILDLLSADERSAVEAHLGLLGTPRAGSLSAMPASLLPSGGCAACRHELDQVRADLGLYALASVPLVEAPLEARERFLSAVAAEPIPHSQAPSAAISSGAPIGVEARPGLGLLAGGKASVPATGKRTSARALPLWLGWAVAAALAVVAVHFYQSRQALRGGLASQQAEIARLSSDRVRDREVQARAREVLDALTDRSAQRVTLNLTKAAGPPQPSGRATYLASRGTLIFLASHLDPLPAGKTYQLWVIPASGAAPVPAGTFAPDAHGSANLVTARLQPGLAAKAFGVTLEPAGGSTSPTLPILLAGS